MGEKAAEDESIIQQRREGVSELPGEMPSQSRVGRVTVETMVIFRDPLSF
jgi:hypothetical protein